MTQGKSHEETSEKVGPGFSVRQADAKNVPALRFPEFEGAWEEKQLSEVASVARGKFSARPRNDPQFFGGDTPFVQTGDVVNADRFLTRYSQTLNAAGIAVSRVFPKDTILITIAANIGDVAITAFPVACPDSLVAINAKNGQSTEFLFEYLGTRKNELDSYATQNAQANINLQVLEPLKIPAPSLPEQKKIAAFLGVVDARIAALRARRAGLERYKRGLMQALFSQVLRFTRSDGSAFPDWEEKRLGEVFERVTRKNAEDNQNVLTISAQQGLVNQRDYFNKSVSAQDVSGYYLLHKGDFAYNKSYSKGYPMGAIKRLNMYEKGVVSTLYICFRTKGETTAKFYEQFFEFGGLNREIHKIAQEGARNHGLLNMSVVEFFKDMIIPYPHPDEQAKIAEALSAMDAKIAAVGDQVTRMEAFKKGLLQQMFV